MNDTPRADCGVETLPTDHRRAEWYVVVDEVWPRTHGAAVTAYTDQRQARCNPTPLHSGGPGAPSRPISSEDGWHEPVRDCGPVRRRQRG
jgi:hypothetical protein